MRDTTQVQNEQSFDMVFRWKNTSARKRLFGRRCRIVARGSTMNSILVEFEDGERVVTSAWAVRRA